MPHRWKTKARTGPTLSQGSYSLLILTYVNLVWSGFAHHKDDLGLSTFGCVHWSVVGEVAPPVPLGPGWKLKVQTLILRGTAWTDVHTKFGGFIRWGTTLEIILKVGRFFSYIFTYCWLLPWRTKLKLTPCTKPADRKWKTSKTALKTDPQSWTNFQLAFPQLMYLSSQVFDLRSRCRVSIHSPIMVICLNPTFFCFAFVSNFHHLHKGAYLLFWTWYFPAKPSISSPTNLTMITVDEGKSFTLGCTATGVPSPNIRWQYQGSDVSGPSKGGTSIGRSLQTNSITYHVVESTPDLSGWYTCRAEQTLIGNTYSDSRMINLNVKGQSLCFRFHYVVCVAVTKQQLYQSFILYTCKCQVTYLF